MAAGRPATRRRRHPEAARPPGHRLADAAHADEPQRRPVHRAPRSNVGDQPGNPPLRTNRSPSAIRRAAASSRPKARFGGRLGQHAGRVRHRHAALRQAARSTLSTPTATLATTRTRGTRSRRPRRRDREHRDDRVEHLGAPREPSPQSPALLRRSRRRAAPPGARRRPRQRPADEDASPAADGPSHQVERDHRSVREPEAAFSGSSIWRPSRRRREHVLRTDPVFTAAVAASGVTARDALAS